MLPSEWIPAVGERTGRIYACSTHRDRLSITKAVLGAGAVAAFQTGMDRAAPGLREKIYDLGSTLMGVVSHVKGVVEKDRERSPAE